MSVNFFQSCFKLILLTSYEDTQQDIHATTHNLKTAELEEMNIACKICTPKLVFPPHN